ncbi:MAG: YIP1 family protein [Halanaerobiales bacterium]|nr:YIP1 family protein [Halanaerobiales bacterium]
MKSIKNGLTILVAGLVFLLNLGINASSAPIYQNPDSYLYNFHGEAIAGPAVYRVKKVITDVELGLGNFKSPQDLFVRHNRIYLVDSGNNRIICFNQDWEVLDIISQFSRAGQADSFNNPTGIFVSNSGKIYLADLGNRRIVIFDQHWNYLRVIQPATLSIDESGAKSFSFHPRKVIVDRAERIYVIAQGIYDGLVEFDEKGIFKGFIGAPRVSPNLVDYIWRRIVTREQRERLALFLPTEYSNFDLDHKGFILAVAAGRGIGEEEVIKRLNPSGGDVLRRNGFFPPVGDIDYPDPEIYPELKVAGPSLLVDICAQSYGLYSVLDRKRGRIFTYDDNGNLLYVFGGSGRQKKHFRVPVALENIGEQLLILDSAANKVVVFEPTRYARLIQSAKKYYQSGQYDQATRMWQEVLKHNSNMELAYSGIGRSLLRQRKFKEAMATYRLGNDRVGYSKAFGLYRRQYISQRFGMLMTGLVLLILLVLLFKKMGLFGQIKAALSLRKTSPDQKWYLNLFDSLKYALYVIIHPFDGFWDLKYEKRGNVLAASVLLLLVNLTYILMRQYTGFIFNTRDLNDLNIYLELISVLVPFFLWCIVNWALTTLWQGKGTFRDIYIYTAYALTPLILINIPLTMISNLITSSEGAFYYFFLVVALLWSIMLVFFATMVTHHFELKKTFFISIFIIVGMGVVLFIGLLFFSVISQMVGFFNNLRTELIYRL